MFSLVRERFVLQWHITHACNLRCKHCYQEDYGSHMSKEQMTIVLDKFSSFVGNHDYIGQINLTGGEPLFHPEFFWLAKEIRKRRFRLGILTNGTLIDQQAAEKLAELQPAFVQVSLDGTKKIHDTIRGKGAFKQTLKAIKFLKRQNIRVLVSFTAQKSNYKELSGLARVCKKYRVDKLWWDRVVTENEEEKEALALSTSEFQEILKVSGKLNKKYKHSDGISMVTNQRALQFLGCSDCQMGYYCSAGKHLLAVVANGGVMPCRRLPFVVGNIFEKDFEEILESEGVMKELRNFTFPEECTGCEHLVRCKGGARCVTYGQTKDLYAKDINCFWKNSRSVF